MSDIQVKTEGKLNINGYEGGTKKGAKEPFRGKCRGGEKKTVSSTFYQRQTSDVKTAWGRTRTGRRRIFKLGKSAEVQGGERGGGEMRPHVSKHAESGNQEKVRS